MKPPMIIEKPQTLRKLPQIALGYIRGHEVLGAWHESLLSTLLYDYETWNIIQGRVQPQHCAHYFNVGRNTLTRKMLNQWASECGVFVSLDCDHTFTPEQVMQLVAAVDPLERPIVSGLYYACDNMGEQVRPVILDRKENGQLESRWEFPANELVECDVVGMGFCAIAVPLLLEMRKHAGDKWFDFDETVHGDFMPEDNAFCDRAQNFLGAKVYVHTGIEVGHLKPWLVRGEHMKRMASARPLVASAERGRA